MGLFKKNKDVIDLTSVPEAVACQATWGQPGKCPKCEGRGYLDKIDIRRRVMSQHCVDCGHAWHVSETETKTE